MDVNKSLQWIGHASFIYRKNGINIFIDPFNISPSITAKADLVLITHAHFDHCNPNEIRKISKQGTRVIAAPNCFDNESFKDFEVIRAGESIDFKGINISAVPAYNVKKNRLSFHPKEKGWVGYVLEAGDGKVYHAGDTDFTDEMSMLKNLDIALMPMGGTYVMDVDEVIEAAKAMSPKTVVPMHYKALLGLEKSIAAEEKLKGAVSEAVIMKEIQEPVYGFNK
jgi:L-ascorbate metabolism protein UlaG (beta-lactamase superfamily)